MEKLGNFVAALLFMTFAALMKGFVFMKLWEWIVAPTFNTPTLSLAVSIGLLFIWTFLTTKREEKDAEPDYSRAIAYIIAICLVYLTLGWVVTLFM